MATRQPPAHIKLATLRTAKQKELVFWIDAVNKTEGRRVLKKTGKLDEQRARLAEYYGIDLTAEVVKTEPTSAGPVVVDTVNREIRARQWEWLRQLGKEWEEKGDSFALLHRPIDPYELNALRSGLSPAVSSSALAGGSFAPHDPLVPGALALPEDLEALSLQSDVQATPATTPADGLRAAEAQRSLQPAQMPQPTDNAIPSSSSWTAYEMQPQLPSGRSEGEGFWIPGRLFESTNEPRTFIVQSLPPTYSHETAAALVAQSQPSSPTRSRFSIPLASGSGLLKVPIIGSPLFVTPSAGLRAPVGTDAASSVAATDTADGRSVKSAGGVAHIIRDCELDIKSLNKATRLQDVIALVKAGEVQAIRAHYGPSEEERLAKDPDVWRTIKTKVNRYERIFDVYAEQFDEDDERFFRFFQQDIGTFKRKPRNMPSQAPGAPVADIHCRSLRLISEAIPHCGEDIAKEKEKDEYTDRDTGEFSERLWAERWMQANDWEVWRAIGKERYGSQ